LVAASVATNDGRQSRDQSGKASLLSSPRLFLTPKVKVLPSVFHHGQQCQTEIPVDKDPAAFLRASLLCSLLSVVFIVLGTVRHASLARPDLRSLKEQHPVSILHCINSYFFSSALRLPSKVSMCCGSPCTGTRGSSRESYKGWRVRSLVLVKQCS
jgi:hypothetical protein